MSSSDSSSDTWIASDGCTTDRHIATSTVRGFGDGIDEFSKDVRPSRFCAGE
jgi:hypothetical protein